MIRYEAQKGTRINYGFLGIWVKGLWYFHDSKIWATMQEAEALGILDEAFTNFKLCKTVKAFKRFVRKHPQFRGNMELVSRWVGHSVHA